MPCCPIILPPTSYRYGLLYLDQNVAPITIFLLCFSVTMNDSQETERNSDFTVSW